MDRQSDTLPRLTIYLAQVAALCNLFLFFASTEANGYQSILLPPWLLLSAALFLILHHCKNSRTLEQLILITAVGFLVTGLVMSLFFVQLTSFSAHLVAWGFFAITTFQCCVGQFNRCSVHQVLLACELHAMGIGLLLWLSEGGVFYLPTSALLSTMVVVLLNLVSLISVRVGFCGGRWSAHQTITTAATTLLVLAQGGIALLLIRFAIGAATATVAGVTTATRWVGNHLLTLITQFFTWLLSLLPSPDLQSEAIYESQEIISVETMEEMSTIDPRIFILLAAILAAATLAVLLWLLYKFRHWRLPSLASDEKQPPEITHSKKFTLLALLKSRLLAQWNKLRSAHTLFTHRHTPQGAVILLSRVGRSRGLGRQKGESYHCYLTRLTPLCQEEDPSVVQSLTTLSSCLDSALYGTDQGENPLSPKDYGQMLRTVARLPRQK